jgi:hypothetical protein
VLGLALGGRAGARVADRLWLPSCRHTVLRIVRRADLPQRHPAQILGVDDFTFHKGHVYGTILVDLEQHRPVDLLLDRDAELLEGWLVAHPGVTIVSRDRSTEYIRGITASTPRAPQVADRWHLLSNLREALERMLDRLHSQLRARVHMPTNQAGDQHVPVVRMRRRSTNEETARTARRARRLTRYLAARERYEQGQSTRQIAAELHLSRWQIQRFIKADGFPEHAVRRLPWSILRPFEATLEVQWRTGERNMMALCRTVHAQGYTGSAQTVRRWVTNGNIWPASRWKGWVTVKTMSPSTRLGVVDSSSTRPSRRPNYTPEAD